VGSPSEGVSSSTEGSADVLGLRVAAVPVVLPDVLHVASGAGVGQDWTPREQRHTFVSMLSGSGVDIEEIADAVGHINSTVTRAVYRHQIADEITSAATAMDAIFGGRAARERSRLPA
jgi:site-specific recombinase XerC